MVKTLVSLEETTKKTNMNGDESSEESSSSCCSKRHGLSRVRRIQAWKVNRSDVEQLIEMMPFITAPHVIWVWGEYGEVYDAEVTESLLRSIPTTHKLERLALCNITSSPAVEFISRKIKEDLPNLKLLSMSYNPLLGAGVDSLIKHLSCAPHLEELDLLEVKMTPQQVMNLTSAVQQHGNNTKLLSSYHDVEGNLKPEHKWPSENYWRVSYPDLFPNSSPESAHEQEQAILRKILLLPESPDLTSDSSSESEMELEQNDGNLIESEDGKASYESEENQEQEAERNTKPEHERPDLTPDLSSESGMELQLAILRSLMISPELPDPLSESEMGQEQEQDMETQTKFQDLPELKHLPVKEDKKGNLKPGDARSFGESRDPQQQEMGPQTELQVSLPELERISRHEDVERNTESEHERPYLIPDLSSESEMELQLAILRSLMIPPELPDPLSESGMEQEQDMETQTKFQNLPELKHLPVNEQDKKGNLKPGDARSFGELCDPQEQEMGSQTELQDSLPELERISLHETEFVKDPHVQPKQVSTSSPTLDTRPSCQDAPFTVAVPAPSASPASTLLVQAFIPMAHGPNPGLHVRPNFSPQGQAQDHIPCPSLGRYPVTVPPPPGMPGYSVFRLMPLTPPPTDSEPPSTSSEDPVD